MIYPLLRPLFFTLDPETAHGAAMLALRAGGRFLWMLPGLRYSNPKLEKVIWGLRFPNPVGLAAGFDKAGEAMPYWARLGFGFAEIGTFTRHAQPGNPRPRVWRYPEQQALINRFGFNNPGADVAAERLEKLARSGRWPQAPLGVNLGKSKITPPEEAAGDYLYSFRKTRPHADYIAVNVSSPNTPGLRKLQGVKPIREIVKTLVKENGKGKRVPILVKFAPDMKDRELLDSVDAALGAGADGIILTNTTLSREGLSKGEHPEGGMSGATLTKKSDACLRLVSKKTKGRVPIIGVGGIMTPEDAARKMDLGAWLLQIYTGFIYQGPGFASAICRRLAQ